jgi:hypothetical protein
MDSIPTIILQYVVPSIAGSSVLGGIIGYQLKLRLDRRRNRRDLISTWKRELLDSAIYFQNGDEDRSSIFDIESDGRIRIPEESFSRLTRRSAYASFRPHMSRSTRGELENYDGWFRGEGQTMPTRKTTIPVGASDNPVREIIAKEIHRIEKKWKLV